MTRRARRDARAHEAESLPDLLSRAKGGDQAARQEVVSRNAGLVHRLALRLGVRGRDRDDLVQAGCLGLLLALERFDPEKGTRFSTYAVPYVLGEMRKCLTDAGALSWRARMLADRVSRARARLAGRLGRQPFVFEIASEAGLAPADVVAILDWSAPRAGYVDETVGPSAESVTERLEEGMIDRVMLAEALPRLSATERRILFLRYFRHLTQARVGQALGFSQSQVSRLEGRALRKLRTALTAETDPG